MVDVVSVGEILVDMIPVDTDLYNMRFGGAPMNCAVACARLGLRVGAIAAVGDDPLGSFLFNTLEERGVDVSHVKRVKGKRTTIAFVVRLPHGEREFFFYRKPWLPTADTELVLNEGDFEYVRGAKVLHVSGFAFSQEPARSNILELVKYAHENNVKVSFDPTYRPDVWESEEVAREIYEKLISLSDIVLATLREYEFILGTRDLRRIGMKMKRRGVRLIGVKMGRRGGALIRGERGCFMETYDVPVKDTVGAGDVWNAAVIYGYLRNRDLGDVLALANAVASLKCMHVGAIEGVPTIDEAMDLIRRQSNIRPENLQLT